MLQSELRDYETFRKLGIPMPKLLAAAEELIREDFYADDYVDSTMKLISDNIFYETVKVNYIELIRSILR